MRATGLAAVLGCFLIVGCAETVSFETATLALKVPKERVHGVFAKPDGKGPFPAVVLLHTCGGMNTAMSEDWPNFFRANGYAALTVDTFGSRGAGRCPEARRYGGRTMWRDAYGALAYLAARPDIDRDRIAVMGFSLGASAVEGIASTVDAPPNGLNFAAGISVYGGCYLTGVDAIFPLLEIIGDKDRNALGCKSFMAEKVRVEILPGATHAFDNPSLQTPRVVSGNHLSVYSWDATRRAREAALEFLNDKLGAGR